MSDTANPYQFEKVDEPGEFDAFVHSAEYALEPQEAADEPDEA